jgi:Ca-activated chloride channel family protein
MNSTRKTAAILAAAGGLAALALTLERPRAGTGGHADPGTPATPVEPRCRPTPSSAKADFGPGQVRASLSSGAILRGAGGELAAVIDLDADDAPATDRPPLDLAIVVDRSGSMDGDKIRHARDAARQLVDRLGSADRVALIQYDDEAQIVVPSTITDGEGKARLRAAIDGLRPGGSTNLHGGMALGRDEVLRTLAAGQVSRVILLSDGLANAGLTDPTSIGDAARGAADRGVRITTVGVGDDYNEDLMEAIAEAGRGHYYYVRNSADLEGALAGELRAIQATVATKVELRLRPACAGVEIADVIGYEFRREGDAIVVPMADVFGGDHRKVVVKLRVPDGATGAFGVLDAELIHHGAKTDARVAHRLAVGVEVSEDAGRVQQAVDRPTLTRVLEAESSLALREAAKAYERGDVDGAQQRIRAAQGYVNDQAKNNAIAPAAVAPQLEELGGFAAGTAAAKPDSAEGKALLKGGKDKARKLSK